MVNFFWWRCKSPATSDVDVAKPLNPFALIKSHRESQPQADVQDLPIPGAFPPTPPISPQLAPSEPIEDGLSISDHDYPYIGMAHTQELHTELGSHLHPRRPSRFTSTASNVTEYSQSVSSRPLHTPPEDELILTTSMLGSSSVPPSFTDEMDIDDPWQRHNEYNTYPFGRSVSAVRLCYPVQSPLPRNRVPSIFAPESESDYKTFLEGPAVRPMSHEWLNKVARAMQAPHGTIVAKSLVGDDLFAKDIASCVKQHAWLNDEIINAYLTLLVNYLRQSTGNIGSNPRYHAFNTFFYSNLREKGYQSVGRWAKRAKIGGEALLDTEMVFVPVHEASHWTLMVLQPVKRTIEYFDSLGGSGRSQVLNIELWLRGELGVKFDPEEWTTLHSVSSQQENGFDCGVFLLTNAKAISLNIEPTAFKADSTPLLRKKIIAEIINGGLHGDFSPDMGGTRLL
ncbi:hypothetical protein N7495_005377 [Penicillium taxi]|uniref:uncharacterized protein n=1 Tax=Penicillium taxi TaxID=168475 RepID=UPI002545574C|nr:uncharacterized protein N7495_005377 [Penicillium taxi]KAJ5893686.1 hypothetical protein N7495_005377 [Penicillium taxi]